MAGPYTRLAQARIIGEIHGSQTINVLHFATKWTQWDNPNAINDQLTQLATALMRCVVDTLLPALSTEWRFTGVDAKLIKPDPSDPVFVAADANSVGTQGLTEVSFTAMLVQVRTGGGGRNGRGRFFLPPPGKGSINTSNIDPAILVLVAQFLACVAGKFMGANPTTDWLFGVYSPTVFKKLVGGGMDNAFREAQILTPSPVCSTMVSRKKGRGI